MIDRVIEWAVNRDYLKPVIPLIRQRISKWSDLADHAALFLQGVPELTPAQLDVKGLEPDDVRRILCYSLWRLDELSDWTGEEINQALRSLADMMALKLRVLLAPLFMAISGKKSSTPLFNTLAILGRDITRARLRHALDTIKPMSGKEQGRWRKAYDAAKAEQIARASEDA